MNMIQQVRCEFRDMPKLEKVATSLMLAIYGGVLASGVCLLAVCAVMLFKQIF